MNHYLWWVPIVMLMYGGLGWLSYKTNTSVSKLWMIPLVLIQVIPVWTIVAKVSKNLLFDAMLYDVLAVLTCALTIAYFTSAFTKFSIVQLIGFVLIIVGFILMKVKL